MSRVSSVSPSPALPVDVTAAVTSGPSCVASLLTLGMHVKTFGEES